MDPSKAVDESLRTEIDNDRSLQLLPVVDAPRVSEIAEQQRQDPELGPILAYVVVPKEKKLARRLVMERSRFAVIDGILYYENPDVEGKWRIAVPVRWREILIREAHDGRFGGHFAERRIYEQLRKHYWWDKMRTDVRQYCRACLVCASRSGQGHAFRPPPEVALPFFQWSGPGSGYVATPLNLHLQYVHNILQFTACVVRL